MAYLDGLNAVWEDVRNSFLESMQSSAVELWFGNMKLLSFDDDVLTFSVDAAFKYDLIKRKFIGMIEDGFESRLGFRAKVEIVCEEKSPERAVDNSPAGTGFHYEGEDEPEEIVMPDPIIPAADANDYEAELFRKTSNAISKETPAEREERIRRALVDRINKEMNEDIFSYKII